MTPDDPRHGSNRGYVAGCHEACCRTAHAAHHKGQRTRKYLLRVDSLRVDSLGTRRRIQALMALGWSTRDLDQLLDRRPTYTWRILSKDGEVYLTTAQRIADLYDRLSMTLPDASTAERRQVVARNANGARRRGYAPPLAWDDIDHDPEPQAGTYTPRSLNQADVNQECDEAVILRILAGEHIPYSTRTERTEALRRWLAAGHSEASICRTQGWQEGRYTQREDAA